MKKQITALMKTLTATLMATFLISAQALAITPEGILSKADDNSIYQSIKYIGTMTINKGTRKKPRIKTFNAIARGNDKAYIEFTNPGDRGTKYLKLGDELWVKGAYAERADKISGHKLRESMMGSDYSYEDSMDNEKLIDKYNPALTGSENIGNKECYILELNAKVKKITYSRLIMWVDKEQFVPLKIQYFALSGMLLKEMVVQEVKTIKGKYFPVKVKMEDKQREGSYTLFEMESVVLDEPVNESVFSKKNLEK